MHSIILEHLQTGIPLIRTLHGTRRHIVVCLCSSRQHDRLPLAAGKIVERRPGRPSTYERRGESKGCERQAVPAGMRATVTDSEREGLRSTVNPVEGLKRDKGVSFCDRSETASAPAQPLAQPPRPRWTCSSLDPIQRVTTTSQRRWVGFRHAVQDSSVPLSEAEQLFRMAYRGSLSTAMCHCQRLDMANDPRNGEDATLRYAIG
ncbi:hypothetical protein CMEL01_13868 [Colletotrichum melonis]|uniref:Uncharacterized protein n=1 Tax=Colletotrichum melonis TaxID=1209925 RepID=A0AAI9XW11_9PEZI|nr:hypothetical protein CMEL01_13868 [Colletotrichum melonis]